MVPLEKESNVEVLRQYSIHATRENEALRKIISGLQAQNALMAQGWLEGSLKDQLHRLQKKFYGFGREGLKDKGRRQVGHEGEQLKLHGDRIQEEEEYLENESGKTADIAVTDSVEYEMTDEELEIESKIREVEAGPKAWVPMKNFDQESYEITITERIYTKVVHRQKKYRLKDEYNKTGKDVIVTAKGPVKLKPGCQYSVDFALAVASDKYEYHLPLERQRRKMESAGLNVEVKTLYNLCQMVAEHLEEVRKRIRLDIMNDFCAVHIDESPWLILGEEKKGQMWAMSNHVGSYYQFEPSRGGAVAEEMVKGYRGAILTDALAAYDRLKGVEGIRKGLCWAHVRREFFERIDDFPEVEAMIDMIDELFEVEAKAKTFEELSELRRTESKAIIKRIHAWLLEKPPKYLPGDGIRKAINYTAGHWNELTTFLKDLSLPLSNNDAERALRHVVLGRKNFAGSKTINGADVATTLYTVIESAKKVGLKPKEYMKYVITERWHGRVPKTPQEVSLERFGRNKKTIFPERENWKIPD
jgi:transposase